MTGGSHNHDDAHQPHAGYGWLLFCVVGMVTSLTVRIFDWVLNLSYHIYISPLFFAVVWYCPRVCDIWWKKTSWMVICFRNHFDIRLDSLCSSGDIWRKTHRNFEISNAHSFTHIYWFQNLATIILLIFIHFTFFTFSVDIHICSILTVCNIPGASPV